MINQLKLYEVMDFPLQGQVLPLAILAKTKLGPGWRIPHATWLNYFNCIDTDLIFG
jgi:hypothetical protein